MGLLKGGGAVWGSPLAILELSMGSSSAIFPLFGRNEDILLLQPEEKPSFLHPLDLSSSELAVELLLCSTMAIKLWVKSPPWAKPGAHLLLCALLCGWCSDH